jgi:hypothetical protein
MVGLKVIRSSWQFSVEISTKEGWAKFRKQSCSSIWQVVAELWPCAGLLTTTKTSMNHFEGGNTHESELLTNYGLLLTQGATYNFHYPPFKNLGLQPWLHYPGLVGIRLAIWFHFCWKYCTCAGRGAPRSDGAGLWYWVSALLSSCFPCSNQFLLSIQHWGLVCHHVLPVQFHYTRNKTSLKQTV